MGNNLHVVSNRLPVTIKRSQDGAYVCQKSSGGLVSGLKGLTECSRFLWYGWPGLEFGGEEEADRLSKSLLDRHRAVPCMIEDELANKYYNGFCNSVLWPLLHYQPGLVKFNNTDWRAYCEVNRHFARNIASRVSEGDFIWVHDYHLMLLPAMLREETLRINKTVRIGFFLHTPFPCEDMFRILPVRDEILEGVLQSDLIGFHTRSYADKFVNACSTILNADVDSAGVTYNGKFVDIGVYPIGIEPRFFLEGVTKPTVQKCVQKLRKTYEGRKIMIGIDRLDYIKGIPQKLLAFEHLLRKHPEWIGKVVLVQVAIPSRQDLEEHQILTAELKYLARRINDEFGFTGYEPIQLLCRSLEFDELLAYYTLSDICIVSSTRDGMNLVSYEYVASQPADNQGVLVLSEFAGAAQNLDGALLFNPWSTSELVETLRKALTMDRREKAANLEKARRFVLENTSADWVKSFLSDLGGPMEKGKFDDSDTIENNRARRASGVEMPMGTEEDFGFAISKQGDQLHCET